MNQPTLPNFRFSIPIQIRMSDLDPFAHVNNGSQAHFFDVGRSAYLEHIMQEKIDWGTLTMVLVHLEMDFMKPILIQDRVVCETSVYHVGNKSVKMMQSLRDLNTNEIKTLSKSVLAGYDRATFRSIEIPQKYKEAFYAFGNLK